MDHISSRQNTLVKRFRELAGGDSEGRWLLLDGEHLLGEAMRSRIPVEVAALSAAAADRLQDLVSRLRQAGTQVVTVSDKVLAAISPVREPSGVTAIAARPSSTLARIFEGPAALVLILAGVQDPGNVGAIIRAAEGCGATAIVTADGTADPFGWKALRGAMGSTFRLPVVPRQSAAAAIAQARAAGLRVFATTADGETPLAACDFRPGCAVLLGGEGAGLPAVVAAAADARIAIPMRPPVESLNVATAAAIVLYEAGRQRGDVTGRTGSPDVAV